jgi:uncharacterized protein YggE
MTEAGFTVLSVRGDAHTEVSPDLSVLSCAITTYDPDKSAALAAAARRLDTVLADLASLGGVVRTAASDRHPLSWLARSARSYTEFDYDTGHQERTGRIVAMISLRIEVRDFALLDRLGGVLANHADLHVNEVGWSVDHDNAAWPSVRAAAIDAAIAQARDYAAALGGSLVSVDHVADAGLLGSVNSEQAMARTFGFRASGAREVNDSEDAPSLDPEPIELVAVIEARCSASVRPLA